MEMLTQLLHGFEAVLTPMNLIWSLLGVTLGTAIGILPGIGPALTIALLLPVATQLDPSSAFVIFGGIYYGAAYGSSTTAILVNTPGETGAVITAIDGYRMAQKGRAGAALATAAIGSFVAGTIGTLLLTLCAPVVVRFAVWFGAADYFALAILGFVAVAALLGSRPVLGLASVFMGLALGLLGFDLQSGHERFTFGLQELYDGISVTTATVGLFAVGEVLWLAYTRQTAMPKAAGIKGSLWMTREDWRRSWKPWLRGSLLGFPIGALPAGGAEIPTFLSYSLEKRLSKHPHEFGQGAIEGVAGPEATNNAAVAGVLVPLLTLGLPTSSTAAVMLVAFQQYGIQPGPLLFQNSAALVWAIIASLYIGNLMLLVLNLPLVGIWVRLLSVPATLLYGGVLMFSLMGVYLASNSLTETAMAALLGVVGFFLRMLNFPMAPIIVGLVLGPIAEVQMRRALQISNGDWSTFVSHPIAGTLIGLAVLVLLVPALAAGWRRLGGRPPIAAE